MRFLFTVGTKPLTRDERLAIWRRRYQMATGRKPDGNIVQHMLATRSRYAFNWWLVNRHRFTVIGKA